MPFAQPVISTLPPTNADSSAPAPAAPAKTDRLRMILNGIAAVAAELGPEFVHSDHGTAFLSAGELALQAIGAFL